MTVILLSNLGKVFDFGPILLNVLKASIAEQSRCHRRLGLSSDLLIFDQMLLQRVSSIIKEALQGACEHLIETKCHDAVGLASFDGLDCHVECSTTCGAIIVYIEDRDACSAHRVDCTLT